MVADIFITLVFFPHSPFIPFHDDLRLLLGVVVFPRKTGFVSVGFRALHQQNLLAHRICRIMPFSRAVIVLPDVRQLVDNALTAKRFKDAPVSSSTALKITPRGLLTLKKSSGKSFGSSSCGYNHSISVTLVAFINIFGGIYKYFPINWFRLI